MEKQAKELDSCPSPGCAAAAAKEAVKLFFAILGVDVDVPKEVEEFRKSLRWGDSMRRKSEKAATTIMVIVLAMLLGAVAAKFGLK